MGPYMRAECCTASSPVPMEDPGADVFHRTLFNLQEAARQQRWVEPVLPRD